MPLAASLTAPPTADGRFCHPGSPRAFQRRRQATLKRLRRQISPRPPLSRDPPAELDAARLWQAARADNNPYPASTCPTRTSGEKLSIITHGCGRQGIQVRSAISLIADVQVPPDERRQASGFFGAEGGMLPADGPVPHRLQSGDVFLVRNAEGLTSNGSRIRRACNLPEAFLGHGKQAHRHPDGIPVENNLSAAADRKAGLLMRCRPAY